MAKKEHEHENEKEAVAVAAEPHPLRTATGTPSQKPTDLDEYEGSFIYTATGEEFGLKKVEDDPHERTHHLKNEHHYWEGTEDEFKKDFEKK
jgi:hypothetical protein